MQYVVGLFAVVNNAKPSADTQRTVELSVVAYRWPVPLSIVMRRSSRPNIAAIVLIHTARDPSRKSLTSRHEILIVILF